MMSDREIIEDLCNRLEMTITVIQNRSHYVTPTPDCERPDYRTLAGCFGEQWFESNTAAIRRARGEA